MGENKSSTAIGNGLMPFHKRELNLPERAEDATHKPGLPFGFICRTWRLIRAQSMQNNSILQQPPPQRFTTSICQRIQVGFCSRVDTKKTPRRKRVRNQEKRSSERSQGPMP